ncbi:unnamed protein product [Prunus brigantina]
MPKLTFRVGEIPLLKVPSNRCIGTRCNRYSNRLRTFPVAKDALRLRYFPNRRCVSCYHVPKKR